jgi:transcriptional regulator with XRE-family HTH domain
MIETEQAVEVRHALTLGEYIVQRRGSRRQDELARAAGIKGSTLSKIESGQSKRPSDVSIAGLAYALGVSAETLFALRDRDVRERTVRRVTAVLSAEASACLPTPRVGTRTLSFFGSRSQEPPLGALKQFGNRPR